MNRELRRALKSNDKKYKKAIHNFVNHKNLDNWIVDRNKINRLSETQLFTIDDIEAANNQEKENN